MQEFKWIRDEKHQFGRAGGDYDWSSRDPEEAGLELGQLMQEQEQRGRSLNKRVWTRAEAV